MEIQSLFFKFAGAKLQIHSLECVHAKFLQLCLTLCDPVGRQAPLSKGFSRQDYWSGLLCPPPGDLLNLGMESRSFMSICIGRQVLYH